MKKLIFKFIQNGKRFQVPTHIKDEEIWRTCIFQSQTFGKGLKWSYAGIKTDIRLVPSSGKNFYIFAQVIFDMCANTLNGESMSLQPTVQ